MEDERIIRGALALLADDWTGERLYDPETAMKIAHSVMYNSANDEDRDEAIRRTKLVLAAVEKQE